METIWRDVRYAVRTLLKNRGFAALAILTLGLGIGANTAIFSVVNAVLLRALPFPDAGRLLFLRETVGAKGFGLVSYPDYLDWRAANHSFSEMAAYSTAGLDLTGETSAERVYGEVVTDSYFPLVGVSPLRGRFFLPGENEKPAAAPGAVISYGLWQRRFGGDAKVTGRTIKVNGAIFTVVGIAPQGFRGVTQRAELWLPLTERDLLWPEVAQFNFLAERGVHWHRALARLKPGVTLQHARAEMDTIAERLSQSYPSENKERGVALTTASDSFLGDLRSPLLLLLGAVGCVLFIACANVANLFLVRASAREGEMAVRAALGASRGRLVRQWVTESLLVAVCGGAFGLFVASWGINLVVRILPVTLPAFSSVAVNRGVFAFTAAITLLTGVVLGLVPALRAGRRDILASLKEGAKSSEGPKGARTSGLLASGEIALALVVLAGAGLLLRSVQELRRVNLGFRPDHLITLRFDVPSLGYQGESRRQVGQQILDRVAALPDVDSAALTVMDPFVWGGINRGITVEGRAPLSAEDQDAIYVQEISPNYFRTMSISLLSGRDFTLHDNSRARRPVIVSESFVKHYWPNQNPLGRRLKYGPADSKYDWMEVVGVAGDMRFDSLRQDPYDQPVIYAPLLQSEVIITMSVVARTKSGGPAALAAVRGEIQKFNADVPVYSTATLDERLETETASTRSFALLLGAFAALAASLAAVGVYGVMAARVTRRTREIGIRMALGARPGDVLRGVLSQGLRIALVGAAAGVLGAFWLTRYLSGQLFGVKPSDPLTFALAAAALCGVAMLACWIPARRAMRVDPMIALRYE